MLKSLLYVEATTAEALRDAVVADLNRRASEAKAEADRSADKAKEKAAKLAEAAALSAAAQDWKSAIIGDPRKQTQPPAIRAA